MAWRVVEGDCVEAMAAMDDCSIDAVVCDPPYGIGFMGKDWDTVKGDDRAWGTMGAATGRDNTTHSIRGGAMHAGTYDLSPTGNRGFQAWSETWAREALRVLKPGGHLLAFGGTRTYHRLACAVEDAGFEIRDSLLWIYGSGFPKSLDVSKAIDKAAGAERTEVVGSKLGRPGMAKDGSNQSFDSSANTYGDGGVLASDLLAPATPDAERWQGWGTALKPAHEPIVVARKPLAGTVAGNVLAHGTGALNVDGCRVGMSDEDKRRIEGMSGFGKADGPKPPPGVALEGKRDGSLKQADAVAHDAGRWPANVVLSHAEGCVCVGERRVKTNGQQTEGKLRADSTVQFGPNIDGQHYGDEDGLETVEAWECVEGCPVAELDRQSGTLTSGALLPGHRQGQGTHTHEGGYVGGGVIEKPYGGDSGGASRFFYVAKASRGERNAGLAGFEASGKSDDGYGSIQTPILDRATPRENWTPREVRNSHPTVKPIELMRWLVRLVTPPGGTVLDPFTGSGTTGCAAVLEGFDFIGVEREAEYVKIAEARIAWWAEHPEGVPLAEAIVGERKRTAVADTGQTSIFD